MRFFSILLDKGAAIEMEFVSKECMDSIQEGKTKEITGIPSYFSEDGRYWPKKNACVIVVREWTSPNESVYEG